MPERFFDEIDRAWHRPRESRITLRIIGSAALMLQTEYRRATKDSDVFQAMDLAKDVQTQLRAVAGKGTELHRRCGMYLDVVPNGLPFLPHAPRWHALEAVSRRFRHFDLHALDVTDVAVSKLVRFHGNDRQDIRMVIERGLVSHAGFLERFRSAVDEFAHEARAHDLPRIVGNLHAVERDYFFLADETEIELPHWI